MQKISKYKTATTYAQAWYDASKENHIEDVVFEEINQLSESMKKDAFLWNVLSQPAEDTKQKIKIMDDISKKLNMSAISSQALEMIAENERINILGIILNTFVKIYYKDKGIIEVSVDTAVELTKVQDTELKKVLENKLNAPVILNYKVNPDVLGGLAVRFNSVLIDDTLASKLKNLKHLLLNQKVAK